MNALIEQAVSQTNTMVHATAQMSIENPSYSLSDPETYDMLTDGATSEAGVKVNEGKALTHPAVWQALNMISGDVAAIPLEVFRLEPDGDRVQMREDPLYEIVHWQTNDEMTAFKFWKQMLTFRLLWNNAYAYIMRRGNGEVTGMIPLLPDRTHPERHDGRLWIVTEVDGQLMPLPPSDVFHLAGLSVDAICGQDFIKSAKTAIGLALAELNFVSQFYKNGGRVGGILELPAAMPKPARDKVEEGFKKRYGSTNAFQTIVLRENAKFHQAQVTPEAAQIVEARKESVRDIARFFNLRPGKLGEESKTSFSSKAEDNRDHIDTTLRPHLRDITQECRSKLLTLQQKREGYYFAYDLLELLKMDFKSMSEALNSLRSGEIINPDEARGFINLNKRQDGGGGDYTNPNVKSASSKSGSTGSNTEPAARAFRSLLSGTVRRMAKFVSARAKKLASEPSEFLAWIDGGYKGQRDSITDAVGEIVSAAGEVLEIDIDKSTTDIVNAFIDESHEILQTVANSTSAESLKAVVEANITEWANEAGERYASQLLS